MSSHGRDMDEDADDESGRVALFALAQSCVVPLCLKAVITLGVPEILCDAGPDSMLTAADIAKLIGKRSGSGSAAGKSADPTNLTRILRILVTQDLVKEFNSASPDDPELVETRYGARPALKYLRDAEESGGLSLASLVRMNNDPVSLQILQYLHAPVLEKTLHPPVLALGKTTWEYIQTDTRFGDVFHKSMADFTKMWSSLLIDKYQGLEGVNVLVDVGGGVGTNLAMILSKYPDLQGINFDRPEVVTKGIQAPRLKHVGGDFFESVPTGGDAICLKWVLHNWNDESCVKLLKNVAKALPPHGKLIVMDAVLPETMTNPSVQTKAQVILDMWMMVGSIDGRERTLSELRRLAAAAGFSKMEIVTTVDHLSVMEFYNS